MKLWQCRKSKGGIIQCNYLCKTPRFSTDRLRAVLLWCSAHAKNYWAESTYLSVASASGHMQPQQWSTLQVMLLSHVSLSIFSFEIGSSILSHLKDSSSRIWSTRLNGMFRSQHLPSCIALPFNKKYCDWTKINDVWLILISSIENIKGKYKIVVIKFR